MEVGKLAAVEFKLPIDPSEIVEFPANPRGSLLDPSRAGLHLSLVLEECWGPFGAMVSSSC